MKKFFVYCVLIYQIILSLRFLDVISGDWRYYLLPIWFPSLLMAQVSFWGLLKGIYNIAQKEEKKEPNLFKFSNN